MRKRSGRILELAVLVALVAILGLMAGRTAGKRETPEAGKTGLAPGARVTIDGIALGDTFDPAADKKHEWRTNRQGQWNRLTDQGRGWVSVSCNQHGTVTDLTADGPTPQLVFLPARTAGEAQTLYGDSLASFVGHSVSHGQPLHEVLEEIGPPTHVRVTSSSSEIFWEQLRLCLVIDNGKVGGMGLSERPIPLDYFRSYGVPAPPAGTCTVTIAMPRSPVRQRAEELRNRFPAARFSILNTDVIRAEGDRHTLAEVTEALLTPPAPPHQP